MLVIRALRDSWTRNPNNALKIFDPLGTKEKKRFWVVGATRCDKHNDNDMGRHPEKIIAFLNDASAKS